MGRTQPTIKSEDELLKMRGQYEAGTVSCRKMCVQWSISSRTLQKYIKKYGWVREGDNKKVSKYTRERIHQCVQLSEENKKKLVESGGNELYAATTTYYEDANEALSGTQEIFKERRNIFNETIAGADMTGCKGVGDRLERETLFYKRQQGKLELLLTDQTVIQRGVKATTGAILGIRKSFGLDVQGKDDKAGDVYNVAIIISEGLRKGRERMEKTKELSDIVVKAEEIR